MSNTPEWLKDIRKKKKFKAKNTWDILNEVDQLMSHIPGWEPYKDWRGSMSFTKISKPKKKRPY